ncbi:WAT1-related protein At2g39510-like [Malus sylvestris]|uniref:WAT1-related protein At2g39510-like n=1 Tax=Malus sylvestris TaxID=3752 RepID=UPI0021AC8753|nr:WAT1-related protein At2g39510-like [Malus sylvestris]
MSKGSMAEMLNRAMPFMAVTFMQFGYAGMSIISKFALSHGMSPHVLVVYRHAVATVFIAPFAIVFDRKVRPKMTLSIFIKIVLLGLLEPAIDQNLFYTGMKLTTATFASAMCNVLPAFAFIMAWIFRLEKINLRSLHSLAKILGTIVTVGGAMLMTLINGPMLNFPWTRRNIHQESTVSTVHQDPIKGAIMIAAGCFCWAGFMILQAITLNSYPAELTLATWICLAGTVQGTAVALAFEWNNPIVWSIHFDFKLLAAVYSGIICSGIAYYIQGVVMKERGPVFVTAFSPLSMIIVAIMSSLILAEIMYLGRVIGAMVIVIGLYMVLWGKSKDPLPSESEKDDNMELATNV